MHMAQDKFYPTIQLTFIPLWANSNDNKIDIFFFNYPLKKMSHYFMQTVQEDNSDRKLLFSEKKKKKKKWRNVDDNT